MATGARLCEASHTFLPTGKRTQTTLLAWVLTDTHRQSSHLLAVTEHQQGRSVPALLNALPVLVEVSSLGACVSARVCVCAVLRVCTCACEPEAQSRVTKVQLSLFRPPAANNNDGCRVQLDCITRTKERGIYRMQSGQTTQAHTDTHTSLHTNYVPQGKS
jgi:hypothetical protein